MSSDNSEFRRMMELVNPTEPVFEEITLEDDDSFHAEFGYLGYIPEGEDEVELELEEGYSPGDEYADSEGMVSDCCGAPMMDYNDGFGRCGDCKEMASGEPEEGFYEGSTWVGEAEYQGRKVKLNKPMRGDVKKFKVYVKNDKGNVIKVNFGDKNMKIKKHIPGRRKSFRARHNCDNPGPKTKARYWSCRAW